MGGTGARCLVADVGAGGAWRLVRVPGLYLWRFFTGFCMIANGLYIAVGSFDRVGDAGDLLRHGAPPPSLAVRARDGAHLFLAVASAREALGLRLLPVSPARLGSRMPPGNRRDPGIVSEPTRIKEGSTSQGDIIRVFARSDVEG